MSSEPRISVIVPVYNTEPYLRECLDSILTQTIAEIEVIVINDGSPDRSIDIIRQYEQKDSRIVVIDKANEGVGKARNDGLHRATGEFVAFMDSDDFYPNEKALQKLYDAAKINDVQIAGGCLKRLFAEGKTEKRSADIEEYGMHFQRKCSTKYTEYQYDYGYTSYIYRRELLNENTIEFPYYSRFQDPPFFVRAMEKAGSFYSLDEPVYVYRAVTSPQKISVVKTLDMMKGLCDNLCFSREKGLAKLHCLTAQRLNHEASYMIMKNLTDSRADELIAAYLRTLSLIDLDWLKAEGYPLKETFVPELFTYMKDTTLKYEKLRKKKAVQMLSKVLPH